jgi:hypothetical protein
MSRTGHWFVKGLVLVLALLVLVEATWGVKASRASLARSAARTLRRTRAQSGQSGLVGVNRREALDCSGAKPGEQYECMNDQWVYFETILSSGSTLPLRQDELDVEGSLYMAEGSNITLSGLVAELRTEDCAFLKSMAVITLSAEDVDRIRDAKKTKAGAKYLLVDSGCDGMKDMKVVVETAPRECRIYSAQLVHSGPFGGRFYTHIEYSWTSTRCNYWWIVLISIILITPAIIAIMYGISWMFKTKPKPRRAVSIAVQ